MSWGPHMGCLSLLWKAMISATTNCPLVDNWFVSAILVDVFVVARFIDGVPGALGDVQVTGVWILGGSMG